MSEQSEADCLRFTKEQLENIADIHGDAYYNPALCRKLARALLDAQNQLSALKVAVRDLAYGVLQSDSYQQFKPEVDEVIAFLIDQPTGATEIDKDGEPQSKLQKLNDRMLSLVRDKDGDS